MQVFAIATAALLAISFTASLAPRLQVAAPLLLVLLGGAISLLPAVPDVVVDPEWILAGVLPPLLYAAAVSTPAVDLRRDVRAIGELSVVLVVVSAIALGLVFHTLIPGLPLAPAIALGAIVSPTDAVATSIVREVGVSSRVTSVLQGESLLNDATALALLRSAVAVAVLAEAPSSATAVILDFGQSVVIAVTVGYLVGRGNVWIRSRVASSTANTVISLTVPFVASLPVEAVDASGLVAAVVAGMVTGHRAPQKLSATHRTSDQHIWRVIEFVLEGAVFLLMGLELEAVIHQLSSGEGVGFGVAIALVALGSVLVVRAAYVAAMIWIGGRWQRRCLRWPPRSSPRRRHDLDYYAAHPLGWREGGVLTWAGMRGVVTLVAAQTLPSTIPQRSLLVFIAFVVAAVSLLVQGGTLAWVVTWLRPARPDPEELARERADVDDHLRGIVRAELAELPADELSDPARARLDWLVAHLEDGEDANVLAGEVRGLRLRLIAAQRSALLEARASGAYSSSAVTAALDALDAEQLALERRHR